MRSTVCKQGRSEHLTGRTLCQITLTLSCLNPVSSCFLCECAPLFWQHAYMSHQQSSRQNSWSIAWTESQILKWPRHSGISPQKDWGDVGWWDWVWGPDILNIKTGEPGIRGIPGARFSLSIAWKCCRNAVRLFAFSVFICLPIT